MFWVFAGLAGLGWIVERLTGGARFDGGESSSTSSTSSTSSASKTSPSSPSTSSASKTAPTAPRDVKRLDLAAGWARQLAEHLPVKKHNYDRELMKKFQSAAGLVPDGVYGPKTAGALRWFTLDPKTGKGREIPPFTGGQPAPYLPPF